MKFFLPPTRTAAHPDTMGENNTPTALKGCGVTTEAMTLQRTEYLVMINFRMNVVY